MRSATTRVPLAFGPFRLERDGSLHREGRLVRLTPRELGLLRVLAGAAGRVVSKTELLARLWPDEDVGEASLTSCVYGLRRALGDGGRRGGPVETVHGHGYRLSLPVQELDDRASERPLSRLRVAVAPFACEPALSFLGQGLAGEITSRLGQGYDEVIATSAGQLSRRVASASLDLVPLARRLRLDVLVAGRLAAAEDRIRLELEVLRVADAEPLWSEHFDRPAAEEVLLAAEIAEGIAKRLAPECRRVVPAVEAAPLSTDLRAYHALLQGQYASQSRTELGTRRAIECFRQAAAWDPACAAAHAAQAESHLMLGYRGYEPPLAMAPVVRREAARALELDPSLALARATLAFLRMAHDRDPHVVDEVRLMPEPSDPTQDRVAWLRSQILMAHGFPDEALEVLRTAREINPFAPNLAVAETFAVWMTGDPEEGLRLAHALTLSDPEFAIAHGVRATLAVVLGRREEALAAARTGDALARHDQLSRSACAWVFARSGAPDLARAALEHYERIARRRYVSPSFEALIHVGLEDAGAALASLERAAGSGCLWLPFVGVDPRFEPLREHPRFVELTVLGDRGARP